MNKMPEFNIDGYSNLMTGLKNAGYNFELFRNINQLHQYDRYCFLRHDVDFHILGIDRIAEIEFQLGIRSTYFLLLTSFYNLLQPDNKKIIQKILSQGHDIGLHYDLAEYPIADMAACRQKLLFEVNILNTIFNTHVSAIVMHQPFTGMPDIFKEDSGYIHPHDPQYSEGVIYVSDSCRAWRDETLITCSGQISSKRLQLNLHPELWLGDETNRFDYLNQTFIENMTLPAKQYRDMVEEIWRNHEGPRKHDNRENQG